MPLGSGCPYRNFLNFLPRNLGSLAFGVGDHHLIREFMVSLRIITLIQLYWQPLIR